jgi:hypothetical protein
MDNEERFKEPLAIYRDRLSLKDIPIGYYEPVNTTSNGDWMPSYILGEHQECCDAVLRSDVINRDLLAHCKSARHVGMKCGLRGKELVEFVNYAECSQFAEYLGKGADIYEEYEEIEKLEIT